ncbi:hypothetical protein THMIRHAM_03190 [Thiomicrorhabdus immobilis]|uniref:Uncharacterized protein n=1 Tax=Thiomicrorhabdus immobilis TaxID=2791037 RepID=A0ABM7MB33_9GAMM|nr:hypothetical protein [Thiomicrorhabdus immobilis]BCN92534.1 hypothetical protein THMIRHAM_03190 [Thiomicrorhabdus immobilis]
MPAKEHNNGRKISSNKAFKKVIVIKPIVSTNFSVLIKDCILHVSSGFPSRKSLKPTHWMQRMMLAYFATK